MKFGQLALLVTSPLFLGTDVEAFAHNRLSTTTARNAHHPQHTAFRKAPSVGLFESTSSVGADVKEEKLDTIAISKYIGAAGVQMSLITLLFKALDTFAPVTKFPNALIGFMFYCLSLKSRVFNPLNNARPNLKKMKEGGSSSTKGFKDRKMPSWTPPGVFFPILWILINAPLRAVSSTIVFNQLGKLSHPAILSLILHLTMGDIWNTINNTERRLGTSVLGVASVWASVWYAIYRYSLVSPLAGKLLGVTGLWITVAATLVTQTWRINPVDTNGTLDSLAPVKKVGSISKTKFFFEVEKDDEE